MATLSVKRGRGGPGASAGAARDVSAKKQAREECVMVIVHAPPPDVSDERRKRALAVIRRLNTAFASSPCSTGSNNCCTISGAGVIVSQLHAVAPFSEDSVFVDFGCSAGGVCLYVAAMFGCKAYGVEVETEPVRLARAQAEREGLTPLCTFLENSFAEDFFVGWLEKVGATHVFAYDKVFSKKHWNHLFGSLIRDAPPLVGISCWQKNGCTLPETFEKVQRAPAAPVVGHGSGYKLLVWKNKPKE